MPEFCFRLISWEQTDRFSSNFIYAFILTRSSLGLLPVIYDLFVTELWPLVCVRILFLLNIFRTNGQNVTKLYKYIDIDKIKVNRIFT